MVGHLRIVSIVIVSHAFVLRVETQLGPAYALRFCVCSAYSLRMALPETLRAIREEHGLSVRGLARLADVNPTYLSQVERGIRTPSERWLRAVSDALGLHMGAA